MKHDEQKKNLSSWEDARDACKQCILQDLCGQPYTLGSAVFFNNNSSPDIPLRSFQLLRTTISSLFVCIFFFLFFTIRSLAMFYSHLKKCFIAETNSIIFYSIRIHYFFIPLTNSSYKNSLSLLNWVGCILLLFCSCLFTCQYSA